MKKINTKVSKKVAAIILTSFAACSACLVMGCSVEKTVTTTETHTDAIDETVGIKSEDAKETEPIIYEFETFDGAKVVIDENSIVAQESSEDPEHSELVSKEAEGNIIAPGRDFVYLEDDNYYYVADLYRNLITVADKEKATVEVANDVAEDEELDENPGFFETDLWSISYDPDMWYGYISDEGNVIINYLGEVAGSSYIEISEMDVATAKEAVAILEEKKGKELTVNDDIDAEYTCTAYAPDEVYGTGLYIADFYTIYENNGKVIIVDESVTHDDDDSRAEALAEIFLNTKNALVLK